MRRDGSVKAGLSVEWGRALTSQARKLPDAPRANLHSPASGCVRPSLPSTAHRPPAETFLKQIWVDFSWLTAATCLPFTQFVSPIDTPYRSLHLSLFLSLSLTLLPWAASDLCLRYRLCRQTYRETLPATLGPLWRLTAVRTGARWGRWFAELFLPSDSIPGKY